MNRSTSYFQVLCLLGLLLPASSAQAFTYLDTREAIKAYNKRDYADSLARFQQLQTEFPDDPGARFNLASAQYQTGKYEEAAKGFEEVINRSQDAALKQKALYNLGNTAFRQGNLQASADYYRKALDLKPADAEAKQNLEYVLRAMDKEQQQKKERKSQKNNDKNNTEQSGDQGDQKSADKNQQQASKQDQRNSPSGQKDKQNGQTASSRDSRDNDRNDESGELKEAGSKGEQKQGGRPDAAMSAAKPDPKALAPDEAARLLNTLSDDQRVFIREQAKRSSHSGSRKAEDW